MPPACERTASPVRFTPVFIEYRQDLLLAISRLYDDFAGRCPGAPSFPVEHWEAAFAVLGERARQDVLIAVRHTQSGAPEPVAFSWFPSRSDSGRAFYRGPYLSPDNPDFNDILAESLGEAVRKAAGFEVRLVEARSLHPRWSAAFARAGFENPGVYERWRLFPLKGSAAAIEPPAGGEIRPWVGISDIDVLASLFKEGFSGDWDYVAAGRRDWEEMVAGRNFDPRLTLLAYEGGKPAGYAFGQMVPDPMAITLKGVYLISIDVKPDARRRGWGGALLSKWLRTGYDAGARAAELDVDAKNDAAKSLYRHFGFRRIRTEEVWWFRYDR